MVMGRQTPRPGDSGFTRNAAGQRISKATLQVEAYGTVDELSAYIGVARQYVGTTAAAELYWLQEQLLSAAACMAGLTLDDAALLELQQAVSQLEEWTASYKRQLPPLRAFVIPGSNKANAHVHAARAVARRAERLAVRCHEDGLQQASVAVPFLNRVSDYLFAVARIHERKDHLDRS